MNIVIVQAVILLVAGAVLFFWFVLTNKSSADSIWFHLFEATFIVAFLAFALFVVDLFLFGTPYRVGSWLAVLMQGIGVKGTQILIGGLVIVFGFAAFKFKLKRQRTYGVVEILFAWTAAIITARQMRPGMDWSGQIATLVGAVYIVSRGLGNIKDAANKEQMDQHSVSATKLTLGRDSSSVVQE